MCGIMVIGFLLPSHIEADIINDIPKQKTSTYSWALSHLIGIAIGTACYLYIKNRWASFPVRAYIKSKWLSCPVVDAEGAKSLTIPIPHVSRKEWKSKSRPATPLATPPIIMLTPTPHSIPDNVALNLTVKKATPDMFKVARRRLTPPIPRTRSPLAFRFSKREIDEYNETNATPPPSLASSQTSTPQSGGSEA